MEKDRVTCPRCHARLLVDQGQSAFTCPSCDSVFERSKGNTWTESSYYQKDHSVSTKSYNQVFLYPNKTMEVSKKIDPMDYPSDSDFQEQREDVYLDYKGRGWGRFGWALLAVLLAPITFGIGFFWCKKKMYQWQMSHTYCGGYPMKFTGTTGGIFIKYLGWAILSVITLSIFFFYFRKDAEMRWVYSNTLLDRDAV